VEACKLHSPTSQLTWPYVGVYLYRKRSTDGKEGLVLLANNMTRWNSTYHMLKRANELMDSIELYWTRCLQKTGDAKDLPMHKLEALTLSDRNHFILFEETLQAFHELTLLPEVNHGRGHISTIGQALPAYEKLLRGLEQTSTKLGVGLHVSYCG